MSWFVKLIICDLIFTMLIIVTIMILCSLETKRILKIYGLEKCINYKEKKEFIMQNIHRKNFMIDLNIFFYMLLLYGKLGYLEIKKRFVD